MKRNQVYFCLIAVFLIFAVCICTPKMQNEDVSVIKVVGKPTTEEMAEKLIKDVYSGIKFTKTEGNGENFILRYYCSNVCIDVCKDGVIRYLCDITANSETDLFGEWLFKDEHAKIVEQSKENGAICRKIEGDNIFATLYINPENIRVFAAKIYLKYREY